jgi:hypothetical protein
MFVLRWIFAAITAVYMSLVAPASPATAIQQFPTDSEIVTVLIGKSSIAVPKTFDGVPLLSRYIYRGGEESWSYQPKQMAVREEIDQFYDKVQAGNLGGQQDRLVLVINVTPAYLRSLVPKPAHPGGFQLVLTEINNDLKGRLPPFPTPGEVEAIKAWMISEFPKHVVPDAYGLAEPGAEFLQSDFGVPDALLNVAEPPNIVSTAVEDFGPLGLPLVFNNSGCAGSAPCFSYLESKHLIVTHLFWEEDQAVNDPAAGNHVSFNAKDFPRSTWRGLAQDLKAVMRDIKRR